MSGYFARLAHHTGVKAVADQQRRATRVAEARGSRAAAGPAPLHVVETTFIEPLHAVANERSYRAASIDSDRSRPSMDDVPAHVIDRAEAGDQSPTATPPREVSPHTAPMQPPVGATATSTTPARAPGAHDDSPTRITYRASEGVSGQRVQAALHEPGDGHERVDTRFLPQGGSRAEERSPLPHFRTPAAGEVVVGILRNPSNTRRDEPNARDSVAERYLKEVRAWVAETPEIHFTAPTPAHQPDETPSHEEVSIVVPQMERADSHTGRGMLDVQDLSLSIGSISILIEEPKPQLAVSPPPPHVEQSPASAAMTPTSLSRYYLRRW